MTNDSTVPGTLPPIVDDFLFPFHAERAAVLPVDDLALRAKVTALVPTCANSGARFPRLLTLKFEAFLFSKASGWTREARVDGAWRGTDQTYYDHSQKYEIVVDWAKGASLARLVREWICHEFSQEEAFVTITPILAPKF